MKKLNYKCRNLILEAVKIYETTNPDMCFHYFEEKLTIEESIFCNHFMTWAFKNNSIINAENFEEQYSKFTKTKEAYQNANYELSEFKNKFLDFH